MMAVLVGRRGTGWETRWATRDGMMRIIDGREIETKMHMSIYVLRSVPCHAMLPNAFPTTRYIAATTACLFIHHNLIYTRPLPHPLSTNPSSSSFLALHSSCASLSLRATNPTSALNPSKRVAIAASSAICSVRNASSE